MIAPLAVASAKPEQLVHNAVSSGTRSGYAASERRPGRGGLLVYRSPLRQAPRMARDSDSMSYKNTSIRRPQWYRNAVLSPCSIRIGGIRATAGAHGR